MEATTKDGHVEIEGVVLEQNLVTYLKYLQKNNYKNVDYIRNTIAGASCFIGRMLNCMDSKDEREAIDIILSLGTIHGEFKNFLSFED